MAKYKLTHLYSGNKLHVCNTTNPDAYLAKVKIEAPLAKLQSIEEIA